MVYTAKHTSRTNNKNASKVVSGVLLTTSVLAGMAMAQDNNASADTIDTPTTTQQAQPTTQTQTQDASSQSQEVQSTSTGTQTATPSSSTPKQEAVAAKQDTTVAKQDTAVNNADTQSVQAPKVQQPKEQSAQVTKVVQAQVQAKTTQKAGTIYDSDGADVTEDIANLKALIKEGEYTQEWLKNSKTSYETNDLTEHDLDGDIYYSKDIIDQPDFSTKRDINEKSNDLKKTINIIQGWLKEDGTPKPGEKPAIADKSWLKVEINNANTALNDAVKYTDASVANLRAVLANALKIYGNPNATQDQVDTTGDNLMHAVYGPDGLVAKNEGVDFTKLLNALDYADEVKAWADSANIGTDGEKDGWTTDLEGIYFMTFSPDNGPDGSLYYIVNNALKNHDIMDQDRVDLWADTLVESVDDMASALEKNNIPKPDDNNSNSDKNSALKSQIDNANDKLKNADKYTATTVEKLRTALATANSIYNNVNANQAQIDGAIASLNSAIKGLVAKSDSNNSGSDDNKGNNDNNSGSDDNKGNSSSDTNKGSSDNHQNTGNANNSSKDNSNSSNGIAQNDNHGNSNSGSNATGNSNADSTESTKTVQNGSESLKNVSVTTPAEVAKKAQMSTSSSNQSESKTLPQTGDKSQTSSVWAGIVGIIIAGFGFLGFSKRKHG